MYTLARDHYPSRPSSQRVSSFIQSIPALPSLCSHTGQSKRLEASEDTQQVPVVSQAVQQCVDSCPEPSKSKFLEPHCQFITLAPSMPFPDYISPLVPSFAVFAKA